MSDTGRPDKDQLTLPIVPIANNSSYPRVALNRVMAATNIDEVVKALFDMNLGYSNTACDGGMDRPFSTIPAVTGLGDQAAERSVRTALAPIVLYGIARLGHAGNDPLGVNKNSRENRLVLPLPVQPTSFTQIRAMTLGSFGNQRWEWDSIGLRWQYRATGTGQTGQKEVDRVWKGMPTQRSQSH